MAEPAGRSATSGSGVTIDELLAHLRTFALERDRFKIAVAREMGLGAAEFNALDHLERAGGSLTAGRLAESIGLTRGAVTGLADRLAAAGWIERRPHPYDRRSIVLVLSDKATAMAQATFGAFGEAVGGVAVAVSAEDRAAILAFLKAVTDVAREFADAQSRSADSSEAPVTGALQEKRSQT